MIGRLRGILLEKHLPMALVEVNGIGYEVFLPINNFAILPELGKEVVLYTHFVVREDAQNLYGFINKKQRDFFRLLIKVNGIGPKLALTILSGMEPDALLLCVKNNDVDGLTRIPGIGKKIAQRLVVEMRDGLQDFEVNEVISSENGVVYDAISALISLGYKPHEARMAVLKHKDQNLSSEELVRLALKKQ